jgi:hypothetical protein
VETASVPGPHARRPRISRPRWLARTLDWLPRGRTLPPDVWAQRHRWLTILLIVQAPGLLALGVAEGFSFGHALWESSIPALLAALATMDRFPRRSRSCAVSMGLLTCSAMLVHFTHGLIEAHFHFFVMIPLMALYEDWAPFGLAFGYVLLHHGIAGAIDPKTVYNHPSAVHHPWRWAAIHATFVAGAAFASVLSWRLNERARAEAQAAERTLVEERLAGERRLDLLRHAAQINDDVVQGIVVSKLARNAGRHDEALEALDAALVQARHIVTELMVEGGRTEVQPGELRRLRIADR